MKITRQRNYVGARAHYNLQCDAHTRIMLSSQCSLFSILYHVQSADDDNDHVHFSSRRASSCCRESRVTTAPHNSPPPHHHAASPASTSITTQNTSSHVLGRALECKRARARAQNVLSGRSRVRIAAKRHHHHRHHQHHATACGYEVELRSVCVVHVRLMHHHIALLLLLQWLLCGCWCHDAAMPRRAHDRIS